MSDPPPVVELELEARAENVAVVRQALSGIGEALGWDAAVVEDLRIAVSEACTNVVLHAYPDGGGPMEVAVWLGGPGLEVAVRDRGRGIGPRLSPGAPGLGLGLSLMAALSDEMRVSGDAGASTEVRMAFRAAGPS
ncbi:MAG: ATP-binding protein [Thermoleophilia bacterium]|nr:ATP-binding protein [Thermoleophilia bacterium]